MSSSLIRHIILSALIILIPALFSGCERPPAVPAGGPQPLSYKSFRDVPGVTDEEISAIEALLGHPGLFVYATP